MLIREAATTFATLIDAAVMWARVIAAAGAAVLCIVAFAVGPLIAPRAKAAAQRVARPSWARGRLRAELTVRAGRRRTRRHPAPPPHWARTDNHRYEEAA